MHLLVHLFGVAVNLELNIDVILHVHQMILEHRLILDLRLLNNRGYASLLKKYKDNPHGLEDYGEEKKRKSATPKNTCTM